MLTESEVEAVDRFLAGDILYRARKNKIEKSFSESFVDVTAVSQEKKDDFFETERQKTLTQFFRVAAKAFELKGLSDKGKLKDNEVLPLWQDPTPIHNAFLNEIEKKMKNSLEIPKKEIWSAIFRRGFEKLSGETKEAGWKRKLNLLFETLGLGSIIEQRKLANVLNISQLKSELEELRKSGDKKKISIKERQIANKIVKAVASFPKIRGANNPSEMLENQYVNCAGACTLGGTLMQEAGLNYLVGDLPKHIINVLVTAEGGVLV